MSEISALLTTLLFNSFWQIPLVAAVAFVCSRLLHRAPSVYRHIVWVAALGLCLGLPIATMWVSAGLAPSSNPTPSRARAQDVGEGGAQGKAVHKRFSFVKRSHTFQVALTPFLTLVFAGCYAVFLLGRAARISWLLRCTLKMREAAYPRALPVSLAAIVKRCAKAFAVAEVATVCSPDAVGPGTLSFPRPILILPERFFAEISEEDFSSAVCHELAHIQRHDFLLNLFYEMVSAPVSFHPVVAWIKKQVARTRELACDEAAATKLTSRSGYARSLLRLVQSFTPGWSEAQSNAALGLFDSDTLEERIINLLRKPKRISWKQGAVLAVMTSGLLTVTSVSISAFSLQVAQANRATGDLRQFVGTWTAAHDGTPYLILELHSEKGTLVGGIKVCSFNLDMKDGTNAVTISDKTFYEILPVRNVGISGKSLSFDWKDPDGDEDHFTLEVTDQNAGRLQWVGLPDGLKVAPMSVTRAIKNR